MANGYKTGGRQKGTPNKITRALKDAILMAADSAHEDGVVGYLTQQAAENPVAFMSLLGRVIPLDVNHGGQADGQPVAVEVKWLSS